MDGSTARSQAEMSRILTRWIVDLKLDGFTSPGRQTHSDTALHIPLVILYTKYTGWRQNDFNVYA